MKKHKSLLPLPIKIDPRTLGSDLVSVQPLCKLSEASLVYFETKPPYGSLNYKEEVPDDNIMPRLENLEDNITGYLRTVSEETIESERGNFKQCFPDKSVEVGDKIYAWDSGGWLVLAGRAGELLVRTGVDKDEVVAKRLTSMS